MHHTSESAPKSKPRRTFSQEFKAGILHDCNQPDSSIAAIAIKHQLNPNLVHKWRRENTINHTVQPDFIPLPLAQTPSATNSDSTVVIEVNGIKAHWPIAQIERALPWLKALQQ